jgi:hypothetical protein
MTKNQKIWFSVFTAMFLIPEILWGGIRNLIYLIISYNKFPNQISDYFAISLLPSLDNNGN